MEMPALLAIVTFDGLVVHGKLSGASLHGASQMPWSFDFYGHPVTHETDDRYIICRSKKENLNLYRGQLVAVWSDNSLSIIQRD